ncbi:DNA adenine methylase [Trichocoleus sp. FACHB-90]|uniref:DNA adenine methylase n=1 Tax=Cyanophyceae TaxID=3028117 RepID=UPI0016828821|nr:DNA adenine methylase [Trichocoleus sp. FACHB-90]MBD1927902.1 DNA adenine methylase [Trichocoleus sp. FACHB-90]
MLVQPNTENKNITKPFLKWAGGKSKLLEQYKYYFPTNFKNYYEPFLGGGAVFFYINQAFHKKAVLTDINNNLIETYLCVRDNVEHLIELLSHHQIKHNKAYYYEMRSLSYNTDLERAARLIYLNKTCFNGLYRENSKGKFNVPIGRYVNPAICQPDLLRSVSIALQSAVIDVRPFEDILKYANSDDFVYFDPPYHPLSDTSYFTAYSRYSFNEDNQIKLRNVFAQLAAQGVKVMLSNSDCTFIRELYSDDKIFQANNLPTIHTISASRAINSNPQKRGKISEILVTSY